MRGQLCVNEDGGCSTISLSEESTCRSLFGPFAGWRRGKASKTFVLLLVFWRDIEVSQKIRWPSRSLYRENFWLCESVSGLLQQILARLLRPPVSLFNLPRSRASLTANHKRWIQTCCESSLSFSGNTSNKTKICCRKYNSSILFATRRLNLQHYILLQDKLVTHAVTRATKGFKGAGHGFLGSGDSLAEGRAN